MFLGVVVHATVLLIVAYFILFAASKANGVVGAIGKLLALWVFALAVLMVVCTGMAPGPDHGPWFKNMMRGQIGNWMHAPEQSAQPAPAPHPTPAPSPQAQPTPSGSTTPKH